MKLLPVSLLVILGVCAVLAGEPAAAHHSFAAEFDSEKPVSVEGTVTKLEWRNPHIWIYFDVVEEGGKTSTYQCEGGSPNALGRRGWSSKSLQPGTHVVVDGFRARRDPYSCSLSSVKLADGTRLFAGSGAAN